jgi:hypothetical protein
MQTAGHRIKTHALHWTFPPWTWLWAEGPFVPYFLLSQGACTDVRIAVTFCTPPWLSEMWLRDCTSNKTQRWLHCIPLTYVYIVLFVTCFFLFVKSWIRGCLVARWSRRNVGYVKYATQYFLCKWALHTYTTAWVANAYSEVSLLFIFWMSDAGKSRDL